MTADDPIEEPAPGDPTPSPAVVAVAEPELDDLLGQLSRAMHAAAESQHLRIVDELARQRAAQVDAIKASAASDAAELKKDSKRDIGEIDVWAKAATELIAAERVRRIDARRERLEAELARRDRIVERQVTAVDVTLEEHQARLEAFFNQLGQESDPSGIAQVAHSLPTLPALDEIAETARRHALAEFAPIEAAAAPPIGIEVAAEAAVEVSTSRLMAVMDPEALGRVDGDVSQPAPEPVAIAGSGRLLRAIPSIRPMDRLRGWNRSPDDDPDREA
jgi:hypothetical protein